MTQALAAFRALLAQRGEARSLEQITALSGAAFVVVFDPARPALAQSALDDNPFEIMAGALGFAHNAWSGHNAEAGFETMHHAVLQGHPVLVRYGSPARWVVVTGYELSEETVHLMPPGQQGYATAGRAQFIARWRQGSGSGSDVAGSEPFYQFSLGARQRTPGHEEILMSLVRRAAQVMQRSSIGGAPAGSAAWEAAARWLETCADPGAEGARAQAVAWASEGLKPQLEAAQSGTAMLRQAENLRPELSGVAARHEELIGEAQLIARKIDEATAAEGAEAGEAADGAQAPGEVGEDSPIKWQAAAAQASYVAALHSRLAEQLAGAAQ